MSIAYSKHPIAKGLIRADTSAHLRADLDALLDTAGWTTKVTVTNGFRYTLTSPNGYQCKVLIQDYASVPGAAAFASVVVQFSTVAGDTGFIHQLSVDPSNPSLQVIAGICQLFISRPGISGGYPAGAYGSVAGGIPARPLDTGPCVAGFHVSPITNIWWSCGGSPNPTDFRRGNYCQTAYSYCINSGVRVVGVSGFSTSLANGDLCLFPLTPTNTLVPFTPFYPVVTYGSHTPLAIDALIGWEWAIRGQLWDAYMLTATVSATPLDSVNIVGDVTSSGSTIARQATAWHTDDYSTLLLLHKSGC